MIRHIIRRTFAGNTLTSPLSLRLPDRDRSAAAAFLKQDKASVEKRSRWKVSSNKPAARIAHPITITTQTSDTLGTTYRTSVPPTHTGSQLAPNPISWAQIITQSTKYAKAQSVRVFHASDRGPSHHGTERRANSRAQPINNGCGHTVRVANRRSPILRTKIKKRLKTNKICGLGRRDKLHGPVHTGMTICRLRWLWLHDLTSRTLTVMPSDATAISYCNSVLRKRNLYFIITDSTRISSLVIQSEAC